MQLLAHADYRIVDGSNCLKLASQRTVFSANITMSAFVGIVLQFAEVIELIVTDAPTSVIYL